MSRRATLLRQRAREMRSDASAAEFLLWRHLRDRRLDGLKFRRQQPMGRFIVDFCCYERLLIVELDGGQHADQQGYDAARTSYLERRGFRVLRFWNSDVLSNIDEALKEIREVADTVSHSPHPDPLPEGEGTDSEGEGIVEEESGAYGSNLEPKNPLSLRERVRVRGNQIRSFSIEMSSRR